VGRINVVVATTSPDLEAEGIARSVAGHPDMRLVEERCVATSEVDKILESVSSSTPCALVLVERASESDELAQKWLTKRSNLVVLRVDIKGQVRIGLRDPRLESLLEALRELVEGVTGQKRERIARIRLEGAVPAEPPPAPQIPTDRPLLKAAIHWVHRVLREAVARVPDENGDVNGLSVTRATLLQSLDAGVPADQSTELRDAEQSLQEALEASSCSSEPLAVACRIFNLTFLEFRILILGLAPELDIRYQRCMGFLLDEVPRRVGTFGLYNSLLGITLQVREELAQTGALSGWLVFETEKGQRCAADEPLRTDPFLAQWLIGDGDALEGDPRLRRLMRMAPWPGSALLERREERANAISLVARLQDSTENTWLLFSGDDSAGWRALLELGAQHRSTLALRIDLARLAGSDLLDIEDSARRAARIARLTGSPLVMDLDHGNAALENETVRLFFAAVNAAGCHAGVICREDAHAIDLLGPITHEMVETPPLPLAARVDCVCNAARAVDVYLTEESAEAIARRYPLQVDGLERAMSLARSRRVNHSQPDPYLERFTTACKDVASSTVSHLAERIEPIFGLDDIVLPADRKEQLNEIVDHVRLAGRVLDDWHFRELLPYGRGVTALFFGPSGTGKTMAAMGIARQLGIQILRLDLSKVVSKYIGDTEKNIDCVFHDAHKSGSAILIDEAEALMGKRSEVRDAHDRYANIEVAYLLQRMEAYDGLAILTTNLRQNLDPAFLRRLRFIVEFPRPDVAARKQIWQQCLPEASRDLDDFDFRQLARKIELTGGNIRQISLCAAFLAAAAGTLINLKHIAQATRAELAKLGMSPVELEMNPTKVLA
jgi:AAA+ superfamily predicted ATPase